jgi:hypothetical protein
MRAKCNLHASPANLPRDSGQYNDRAHDAVLQYSREPRSP